MRQLAISFDAIEEAWERDEYSTRRNDEGLRYWVRTTRADPVGARLADGHYSRQKVGAKQYMPPGQVVCLLSRDAKAMFGWMRPHPYSGIIALDKLDGWRCTIFRNTGPDLASLMIVDAERALAGMGCGPDGLLTYVWPAKIKSSHPGLCFKAAGYRFEGRWSVDRRKMLLRKPSEFLGKVPKYSLRYWRKRDLDRIPQDLLAT